MSEDLYSFFKIAQEEDEEQGEEDNEDVLDNTEDIGEDVDQEDLQDLGFSDTEVDPEQADSAFFFQPSPEDNSGTEKIETTEYKVDEQEETILKHQKGIDILLEAHRVDWIIKSAYQSLFLFLRDSIKDSKNKDMTYRIKFVNTPWSEGSVAIDTLSRFNVYYETFSEAIKKIEPKVTQIDWSPTFQEKDLFLTFRISIK